MKLDYVLLDASVGGGTVRTVFTMAQALAERGHEVRIVSVLWTRPEPAFTPPAAVPIQVLVPRRPAIREWWRRPREAARAIARAPARRRPSPLVGEHDTQAWRYSAATDAALRRHLRRTDAEVVVGTRSGINLTLAQLEGSAAVLVQEHVGLHLAGRRLREALRDRLHRVDAVVTLTGVDARRYRQLLDDRVPVHVVPNAVEPTGPDPDAGSERARVVLAAGRLAPQKGFDLLVEAWRPVADEHPDWELHIYGRGPLEAQLRDQIEAAGLTGRVVLRGFAPDLHARLQQASAFVLSSRFEGLPMVLLEAMACGLPVVAFDCPTGPRQVIRDARSGLLVPRESVPDLSEALLAVVGDADLRHRLSVGATHRVEHFSVPRVADRWEQVLSLHAAGRGSPSPGGSAGQ